MKIVHDIRGIGRVGILSGGMSSERGISVKSADAVFQALSVIGMDVCVIDVESSESLRQSLKSQMIDVAFIALHGRFGEDGSVQSLLYEEGIPYTGSGPQASRVSLDKGLSKNIFRMHGIPTPNYLVLEKKSFTVESLRDVKIPCVVKPCNEGSSIGMNIVDAYENINPAVKEAFIYDNKIIIEDYVEGMDITVGILDEKPLPVISIKPQDRFYNYHSKYTPGASEYIVPADLPKIISNKAQFLATMAHKALGCECFSRVDMILGKPGGNIMVLEANTIPGFTQTSLLPKAAKSIGIEFSDMCLIMLRHAVERHAHGALTVLKGKKSDAVV
jgi:D-alanine-D-alanine ligase